MDGLTQQNKHYRQSRKVVLVGFSADWDTHMQAPCVLFPLVHPA